MILPARLLDILACPGCKGPVSLHENQPLIVCTACRVGFPVRDGIPVMLIDEALPLAEAATSASDRDTP